jgi:hypothetical protein
MRRRVISLAELVCPSSWQRPLGKSSRFSGTFPQKLFPTAGYSSALPSLKSQVKIALPRPCDTLSVEFLEYQKEIVGHIVERK